LIIQYYAIYAFRLLIRNNNILYYRVPRILIMVTRFPRDGVVESHLFIEYFEVTILLCYKNRNFLNIVFLLYASPVDNTQCNVIYII